MITINTISNTRFAFNGIQYLKNYISRIAGDRIEIYNCYERQDVLLPLTLYSEVRLNGFTYSSAAELQEEILGVIYMRNTLDDAGISTQNNVSTKFYFGIIPGEGEITPLQISDWINSNPYYLTISEVETPVWIEAVRVVEGRYKRYIFNFVPGKGHWGLASGGTPVHPGFFNLIGVFNFTGQDIEDQPGTTIVSLGNLPDGDYLTVANSEERDFSYSGQLDGGNLITYYFSYTQDGVLYFVQFVGEPGIYGGSGINSNDFSATDFVSTTNSDVAPTPIPSLDEVLANGYQGFNKAIGLFQGNPSTDLNWKYQEFYGGGLYHETEQGDTMLEYEQPASWGKKIIIPAVEEDERMALISDIEAIRKDFLNVLDYGAIADGITDNTPFFQAAVNAATEQNKALFVPKQSLPYAMTSITSGVEINGSIRIISDGAVVNPAFTNTSVKALFYLGDVNENTDIYIEGISTIGKDVEQKFIISQWGTGVTPSPRKNIGSITLKNITTENQNITINFNPKYIELDNIHTGLNTLPEDNINPGILVTYDNTFAGHRLYVNNCSVTAGNRNSNLFFLKGGSYKDVRFTNLTANMLANIPNMTGDGFDMDNMGENVFIDNIKANGCSIAIKPGNNVFGTYAVNASNLISVNPNNAGIGLRAIGNYNNIICRNPVSVGVEISAFTSAPTDGSTRSDAFSNINNILVTNNGAKLDSNAMVTIGNHNLNINNLQIFNEYGFEGEIHSAIRITNCENVNLRNINIKDVYNAFVFASGSDIEKINIGDVSVERCSGNVLQFGSNSLTDLNLNNLFLKSFSGTQAISLNSNFSNIKFKNLPEEMISGMINTSIFTSVCKNFIIDGAVHDKITLNDLIPVDISYYPLGTKLIRYSDNTTWIKNNSGFNNVIGNHTDTNYPVFDVWTGTHQEFEDYVSANGAFSSTTQIFLEIEPVNELLFTDQGDGLTKSLSIINGVVTVTEVV